jgi:hypothetical protein
MIHNTSTNWQVQTRDINARYMFQYQKKKMQGFPLFLWLIVGQAKIPAQRKNKQDKEQEKRTGSIIECWELRLGDPGDSTNKREHQPAKPRKEASKKVACFAERGCERLYIPTGWSRETDVPIEIVVRRKI